VVEGVVILDGSSLYQDTRLATCGSDNSVTATIICGSDGVWALADASDLYELAASCPEAPLPSTSPSNATVNPDSNPIQESVVGGSSDMFDTATLTTATSAAALGLFLSY
jgi:hypothetical protein